MVLSPVSGSAGLSSSVFLFSWPDALTTEKAIKRLSQRNLRAMAFNFGRRRMAEIPHASRRRPSDSSYQLRERQPTSEESLHRLVQSQIWLSALSNLPQPGERTRK